MKQLMLAAVAGLGVALAAGDAGASGCNSPFCQETGSPFGNLFRKAPVPAFQAAPWYLYWPYNAHFQTPAPLTGPYYAPPAAGGFVNPYFQGTPAPFRPAP